MDDTKNGNVIEKVEPSETLETDSEQTYPTNKDEKMIGKQLDDFPKFPIKINPSDSVLNRGISNPPKSGHKVINKWKRKIRSLGTSKFKQIMNFIRFILFKCDITCELEGDVVILNGLKLKFRLFLRFFQNKLKVEKRDFSKLNDIYQSLPSEAQKMITQPELGF